MEHYELWKKTTYSTGSDFQEIVFSGSKYHCDEFIKENPGEYHWVGFNENGCRVDLIRVNKTQNEILKLLEPLILGVHRPEWKCGCGQIHCSEAVAVEIIPSKPDAWYLWSVRMKSLKDEENAERGYAYSTSPDPFLGVNKIERLFYFQ